MVGKQYVSRIALLIPAPVVQQRTIRAFDSKSYSKNRELLIAYFYRGNRITQWHPLRIDEKLLLQSNLQAQPQS